MNGFYTPRRGNLEPETPKRPPTPFKNRAGLGGGRVEGVAWARDPGAARGRRLTPTFPEAVGWIRGVPSALGPRLGRSGVGRLWV